MKSAAPQTDFASTRSPPSGPFRREDMRHQRTRVHQGPQQVWRWPSAHPIRSKHVRDRLRPPLSAASRSNPPAVQRRGDLPKGLRPGGLGLANGGRNAIGECVGASAYVCVGDGAGLGEPGIAEGLSTSLGGGQGGNRALADHLALALGEGGVQVQHERLDVRAELGDDERDPMGHQAGNEMDVSAEAIELGNRDGAFPVPAGLGERGGELRAALDRVGALAGLDLDEIADDLVTLGGGETGDRGALGIDPETGAALLARARPGSRRPAAWT